MSRTRLDERLGPVAQLVERLNGIEEVSGSRPLRSTNFSPIALAKVAELAYASVSKTDFLTDMRVQLPPSAPVSFDSYG